MGMESDKMNYILTEEELFSAIYSYTGSFLDEIFIRNILLHAIAIDMMNAIKEIFKEAQNE